MQPLNPLRQLNYLVKRGVELDIILEHYRENFQKLQLEKHQIEKELESLQSTKEWKEQVKKEIL